MAFALGKAFNYVWGIVFLRKGNVGEVTNVRVGIVISYVSLVFSVLGAFIVTPRILEWLGDTQYGLRSFATSITTWLTIISSALSASYLRFINQSKKEDGIGEGKMNSLYLKIFLAIALAILAITIIGTSICFIGHVSFGNYTAEENNLIITLMLISGIMLAVQISSSVFTHYLTYRKEFIFIRGLALIISFLTFTLELISVFITRSVIAVSITSLVLAIVSAGTSIFFAVKVRKMEFAKEKLKDDRGILKAIVIFSSFILLNAVVDNVNKQVDITILGFMTNAETVTTYTLAHYFTTYLVSLSVAISGTYAPKVHEYVKNENMKGLNVLFERVSKTQLIILLLVVGGFAACGHSFMYIWLGESKAYIYYYALVLLSLNIIPLSCNLGIEVQRAMNKHKFRAVLYIILASMNVGISVALIALLPAEMAVWAAIFGTVFSVVMGNIIILNIYNQVVIGLNMKKYFLNVLKYTLMTAIAVLPSITIRLLLDGMSHPLLFLIEGATFIVFYIIGLSILDRDIVSSTFRKALNRIVIPQRQPKGD